VYGEASHLQESECLRHQRLSADLHGRPLHIRVLWKEKHSTEKAKFRRRTVESGEAKAET
jgi:hypothetical protein